MSEKLMIISERKVLQALDACVLSVLVVKFFSPQENTRKKKGTIIGPYTP